MAKPQFEDNLYLAKSLMLNQTQNTEETSIIDGVIGQIRYNKDINRLYKKIIKYDKYILYYINDNLYKEFKKDINIIYDNIINGEDDETFINDFIINIRIILIKL